MKLIFYSIASCDEYQTHKLENKLMLQIPPIKNQHLDRKCMIQKPTALDCSKEKARIELKWAFGNSHYSEVNTLEMFCSRKDIESRFCTSSSIRLIPEAFSFIQKLFSFCQVRLTGLVYEKKKRTLRSATICAPQSLIHL